MSLVLVLFRELHFLKDLLRNLLFINHHSVYHISHPLASLPLISDVCNITLSTHAYIQMISSRFGFWLERSDFWSSQLYTKGANLFGFVLPSYHKRVEISAVSGREITGNTDYVRWRIIAMQGMNQKLIGFLFIWRNLLLPFVLSRRWDLLFRICCQLNSNRAIIAM